MSTLKVQVDKYVLGYYSNKSSGKNDFFLILPVGRAVGQNWVDALVINGDDDRRHVGLADQTADAPLQADLVLLFVDFALILKRRVNQLK